MPISFNDIPANWKQPLYWVEVDPSKAGVSRVNQPALLTGIKLSSGSAVANVPVAVGSLADARALFGSGSMLDAMVEAFIASNYAHELWVVPVAEPGAGQTADGAIEVTSAPTQDGTLAIYIAGRRVYAAIDAGETLADVAVKIAAAINADTSMPVVATHTSGDADIALECRWKGATGNDIDIRVNYGGSLASEVMPVGLALTITAMTGGSGVPDYSGVIAALGEEDYEYVAVPETDSTTMNAWDAEFGFGDNGRWGWMRQKYGHIFSAKRGSYADLLSWGATVNYPVPSVLGIEPNVPSPVWAVAAAYCGKAGRALLNDPARPLQTLVLDGILPAPKHQRFLASERNALANKGVATQETNAAGKMMILRETTTYQKNKLNQPDEAYELVTTLATLARVLRNQRSAITTKYPRHKLADNGTRFGPGQAILTPNIIKAELIAQYREDEFNGLVENAKAFKDNTVVERDSTYATRVNVIYPPDLINGMRMFAVLAQFRLQYATGSETQIV